MYEAFTNKYKLSKTLRFALEPQGATLSHIEANGILEEDQIRAEEAKKVKKLANDYHKAFIDRILDSLSLHGIEAYEFAFFDDSEKSDEILACYAKDLREQITAAFKNDPAFESLGSGKLYTEVLPAYFAEDKDALASLSLFQKFTTYFRDYNEKKLVMYDASGDKDMPKRGTIACRVIDENLPIFLINSNRISCISKSAIDLSQMEEDLELLLQGETLSSFFGSENYSAFLTQRGIDRYNQVIGGYTKEDGTKIKGLNEYINLHNQKASKTDRLPMLKKLKKQILSEKTTLSFIPEAFDSDEEVTESILAFDESFKEPAEELTRLMENIRDYDTGCIYISSDLLRSISNKVFGSWHYIDDLLSDKYDRDSGTTEKQRETKKYKDKKEKDLRAVKEYSVGELDAMPGIDGKVSKYIAGAAGFSLSAIDIARKDMLRRFELRSERNDRSLKRDDFAKSAIKGYLDACLDFKKLVASLDPSNKTPDFDFYFEREPYLDDIYPVTTLYNKTRNYLSGKLYKNEQVKLNFDAGDFLGGWAESQESVKRGTILIRDGEYYLGVIAKGQGDLFSRVPDAKTNDIYQKMRFNQIANPARDIPKAVFSKKGIENLKPADNVLEAYRNKSFIAGEKFNIDDCHSVIDYYKRCIREYGNWHLYNFDLKETADYKGINEFYRDISLAYDLRFRDIDRAEIDSLVEEGKLYLFKLKNKDMSAKSTGKPNLFTMYWNAVFSELGIKTTQFRLCGGAEMFYRKASIKEADIIRHREGDRVEAKNPNTRLRAKTLKYEIIKDRRFTMDHFQLNVPITINATSPEFCNINTEARLAIKESDNSHVIGVSRGENSLIHITVLDSKGNIIESRSLNVIEAADGRKTDYARLLAEREAARDEQRRSWATIEGIKQLKEGYISQVVHILTDLMIKYDAVIAIEDLNLNFKQSRQKVEKAVYQQLEEKLIRKLNFLVDKDAEPNEPGGVYRGYQLTLPFQTFEKVGKQTGFIFYVSPWKTTDIDPATGFINLFDTRYTSRDSAVRFWSMFDGISYDAGENCYRFDFDYSKVFENDRNKKALLDGTRTGWSIYIKGEKLAMQKTGKGVKYVNLDLGKAIEDLFDKYDVGSKEDLREEICAITEKAFHEELLNIFGLAARPRSGSKIKSCVKDDNGRFYEGLADANGSYNIARKGLVIVDRIREASAEALTAKGKGAVSVAVTGNDWLRSTQN
jgi:CRISPR-associated protein Cpf1